MISISQAKFVKSLKLKKYRQKAQSFLVEGAKNVLELLDSDFEVQQLFVTEKFLEKYGDRLHEKTAYFLCTEKELASIGTFKTNEFALAVAKMRRRPFDYHEDELVIALDGVSDPGNLGTIIRIADWYGVANIVAGPETADFYNPKVINASMGSFTRVCVHAMDLRQFFMENERFRVYGAVLDGKDINTTRLQRPAVLLMGSESAGISESLLSHIHEKITIPRRGKAESLNVAVSTAIICDHFFRG